MTVCPLCEHAQAEGAECESCGRALEAAAGERTAVPPLEGLEPTQLPPVHAAEPAPLDGLEPTALVIAGPPDPSSGPLLDLEATGAAPVEVPTEPMPGLERSGEAAEGGAPRPAPAFPICRYCRTPALPGERRCGRCGMRLPVDAPRAAPAPAPEDVRRCSCGAPATRALCPACGARIPDSERT